MKAVAGALRKRCGITEGERLMLAVSGGADSVAMLRALVAIAPRRTWRLELAVGHVQHHLRTDGSSEEDARFVAELAASLDLPFFRADLAPPKSGSARRASDAPNLEAWARAARYDALAEMARAFDATAVVVAHHADDQLETLLMRLLRGSSLRGLSGMAWHRRMDVQAADDEAAADANSTPDPLHLVRPMLAVDRACVHAFLRDVGQPWREDPTNRDASRTRARLRRDVTPVLHDLRPDVAARTVALTDHWRDIARLIEREVDREADPIARLSDANPNETTLARAEARRMPRVVLAGLLRRLMLAAGAGPDSLGTRQLAPILRAARDARGGRRAFRLAQGVELVVTRDAVMVRRLPAPRSAAARTAPSRETSP
ncbi:MAG: tRNA lysidine(34) synthetase TilS [Planctomycetota bacterium]|nr:tRNA lysidine(34) synthetase TilS [Planctomycetota bacterium]